jgi:hypothetical protein
MFALPTFAQSEGQVFGLDAGEYAVGFQLLEDVDRSRTCRRVSR